MMTYDLVIVGCDGVLVDTERISSEVVSFLLKEQGLEMSPEEVAQGSTGLSETDMWLMYEAELGKSLSEDMSERLLSLEAERFRLGAVRLPISGGSRVMIAAPKSSSSRSGNLNISGGRAVSGL